MDYGTIAEGTDLKKQTMAQKINGSVAGCALDVPSKRATFAQVVATCANSMMFLGVGMMVAVSTVVNGAIHNNENSELNLNDAQASWFGSLMLLFQPVGCVISGILQPYIGRKYGMVLMNVPELVAWALLYTSTSVNTLYLSSIMMGLSAGFMEAPGLSYIGEVCQPRVRGILTSFANICVCVGMLIEFLFGSLFDWRTAVGISAIFPIISIMVISFIPDSPVWLLEKNRKEDALKSLCWLRGWVNEERVKVEFEELCRYTEAAKLPSRELKNKTYVRVPTKGYINANNGVPVAPIEKKSQLRIKISHLFDGAMLRPFRLIIGYQLFFHFAALSGVRSYMIETFSILGLPLDPQWVAFTSAGGMLLGGIICIVSVKWVGKRRLSLISMACCAIGCILLGFYARYRQQINSPSVALVLFIFLYFASNVGIGPIPWMLISEVFPCRGRSIGAGISAAAFYIIAFVFSKTYLDLEHLIHLDGCFFLNGIGGIIGYCFLYVLHPETEGKTLSEVENCFLKNGHRLRHKKQTELLLV